MHQQRAVALAYASVFPDLKHPGFWLFDVLLSTCILQQGIQLQSPKVVGQRSTKKPQSKLVSVPCCRHTHSHMYVAFHGLCAVCACMGLVVCWGAWERRLQDTNCQNNSFRLQLPSWHKPVGHREEPTGLNECFSGLDLACWTHVNHMGKTQSCKSKFCCEKRL